MKALLILFCLISSQVSAQSIQEFTNQIKSTLENHEWDNFISMCEESNWKTQSDIGIEEEQYIYEILNLGLESSKNYPNLTKKTLKTIKTVSFTSTPDCQEMCEIRGIVAFKKSESEFTITIINLNGKLAITGAVG